MKDYKKQLIILFLLIFTGIFIESCEKENENLHNETINEQSNNTNPYKVKWVSGQEISNNKPLFLKIGKLKSQSNLAGRNGDSLPNLNYEFYIDIENVKYIENTDGTFHSYTFRIVRDSTSAVLENLVLSKSDSSDYSADIITYDVTSAEKDKLANGEYVDLSEKINYFSLDTESNEDIGKELHIVFDFDNVNVQCFAPITVESGATGWDDETYEAVPCPWENGGGGNDNGNGDPGNTGGGNTGGGNNGDPGDPGNGGPTGNGGTGNNGSTSTSPIACRGGGDCPEEFNPELQDFIQGLNTEQIAWWLNPENEGIVDEIEEFFNENGFTPENEEIVQEVIDACINNTPIVVGPDIPIINLEEYLNCFNTSQNAIVTIYADQPSPNYPNIPISASDGVGHSFISIEQGNHNVSFGFYPSDGVGYLDPTDGIMGNDQNHGFDVSVSISVSPQTLQTLITHSLSFAVAQYDLQDTNCTDFAITAGNIVGFDIPKSECTSSYVVGNGATPGKFGDYLRNMALPNGATPDRDGGTTPPNNGCD